jgi:hypothetical protein
MNADIWALQQLKARYFRYLDTKQWDNWRQLFTDDMVFYMEDSALPQTQEPITTSGDDFVEYVSELLTPTVTVHHGHMPELEITGERTAKGVWAMYDWVDNESDSDLPTMKGYGHYHEDYEKGDDGQWRIRVLRLTRLRTDDLASSRPDGERPRPGPWKRPVSAR